MSPPYIPSRWHWHVTATGGIWSSAAAAWIDAAPEGAGVTAIPSVADLDAVLRAHGLPSPLITVADVRAEAQRRIVVRTGATDVIAALVRQMNAQMRATELTNIKIARTLTPAEQAEADALQALADAIKAIRAASNVLDSTTPIPTDFAADSRWP